MRTATHRLVCCLLALVLLHAAGCRSTRFPETPAEHPLWAELQEASDPYYFLVRTGLRSRVLGIQPEAEMRRLLDAVRAEWPGIDRQPTAAGVAAYLTGRGLTPVALRVTETLDANAAERPADFDAALEAAAVKVALLGAYELAESEEE